MMMHFPLEDFRMNIATPDGQSAEVDVIGLQITLEHLTNRWADHPAVYIPKVQDHIRNTLGLSLSPGQTWQLIEAANRAWKVAKKKVNDLLNSVCALEESQVG